MVSGAGDARQRRASCWRKAASTSPRARGTVDLGEVTELDSRALALCLAWLREAQAANRELAFANLPERCKPSSRLYGVEDPAPCLADLTAA